VYERADLAVGGSGGDDDLLVSGVAPAAGAVVGQLADLDRVSEFGGVGGERGDQVAVAVARDRLRRRRERDGLFPGQGVGHRDVPDGYGPEEDLPLAGLLAVIVALLDAHWGEDADRGLALADDPVEGRGTRGIRRRRSA
jgi:hypothetical protein